MKVYVILIESCDCDLTTNDGMSLYTNAVVGPSYTKKEDAIAALELVAGQYVDEDEDDRLEFIPGSIDDNFEIVELKNGESLVAVLNGSPFMAFSVKESELT